MSDNDTMVYALFDPDNPIPIGRQVSTHDYAGCDLVAFPTQHDGKPHFAIGWSEGGNVKRLVLLDPHDAKLVYAGIHAWWTRNPSLLNDEAQP